MARSDFGRSAGAGALSADAIFLRDQLWARYAYDVVGQVPKEDQRDYRIAVNDLGANILRSGLCAALAAVQRRGERGQLLLAHLAGAGVPGLEDCSAEELVRRVRELDVDAYMVVTREMLRLAAWLKRAVQAMFEED